MRVLFFLLLVSIGSHASNYVVIGAFGKKANAMKLAKLANAQIDLNYHNNLTYVFVLKTEDRNQAYAEARRLQRELVRRKIC